MEAHLWPYQGGAWRERVLAAGLVAELLTVWLALYALAWTLGS